MSKLTIKASYQTGDSFRTEDTEELLGYVVEKRETARLALSYLKKHYESVENHGAYSFRKKQQDVSKEIWYAKSEWSNGWECSVMLPLDDESLIKVSVPYTGYFERLYGLDIVSAESEDDKDSVRI